MTITFAVLPALVKGLKMSRDYRLSVKFWNEGGPHAVADSPQRIYQVAAGVAERERSE